MARTYEEKLRDAKAAAQAAVERSKLLEAEGIRRTAEIEKLAETTRYVIIPDSWDPDDQEVWEIFDTTKPTDERLSDASIDMRWEIVCECYDKDDATLIAAALNAAHSL